MFTKFFAGILILAAAGCASQNVTSDSYHPYEKFDEYKPYEETIVAPLSFVEFIPEMPGIVCGK